MRNDVITLVSKKVNGASIESVENQVFARKKSVRQSEFYAAYQVGLNPSLVFVVDARDFDGASEPTEVIYNGKTYTIIRTYCTGATVEITVG